MSRGGILALFGVLGALGWLGLGFFTYYNPPLPWNRWIALAMLWPTLFATLLVPLYWVHRRREPYIDPLSRSARQSALGTLFLTLCISLQMARALNWANGILLLLLIILAEMLLTPRSVKD